MLHRPFAPRPGESLESVVDAALGRKLNYEIVQSGPWRPQFLVADSFGRGRVFIAGDATHQYMPTGGLGMNTGVAEAHNLAWKLAACVKGWGGAGLMNSYEAERLPVARRNREHVKRCAAAAFEASFATTAETQDASPAGEALRAAMAREFEAKVSRLYESLGVEIGYRYRASPVVVADTAPEPPQEDLRYVPTAWSGARLPSLFLADGSALFDALSPDGFTLLCLDGAENEAAPLVAAAAGAGVPLKLLPLAEPRLRPVYETRLLLVRPDQHVCWRGDTAPADCTAMIDAVRGAGVEA